MYYKHELNMKGVLNYLMNREELLTLDTTKMKSDELNKTLNAVSKLNAKEIFTFMDNQPDHQFLGL